ncbi:MAG: arsenate reductase [Bacteroidia bacterium]
MKIYHNARCSKSREACELLNSAGKDIEIVDYMTNPLSEEELNTLIHLLGITAYDLVRKKEKVFVEKFKMKNAKRVNWVKAMIKYPVLMERPIIVSSNKAIIGRPPSLVLDL